MGLQGQDVHKGAPSSCSSNQHQDHKDQEGTWSSAGQWGKGVISLGTQVRWGTGGTGGQAGRAKGEDAAGQQAEQAGGVSLQ